MKMVILRYVKLANTGKYQHIDQKLEIVIEKGGEKCCIHVYVFIVYQLVQLCHVSNFFFLFYLIKNRKRRKK